MTLPLSAQKGLTFAAMLPNESSGLRHAGKGIKSGDGTSPVFWYKPAGASSYRVIYGDLSRSNSSLLVPESPNAVPVSLGTPVADWMREILKAPKPRVMTPPNEHSMRKY